MTVTSLPKPIGYYTYIFETIPALLQRALLARLKQDSAPTPSLQEVMRSSRVRAWVPAHLLQSL